MEEGISRKRFIRLGAAIGVTATGASIVAACGGGESGGSGSSGGGGGGDTASSGGGATSAEASGGSTASSSSGAIAQTSDIPEDSAMTFTNEGQPAVLVHLQGGDFAAYSALCTHQQCEVAYQDGQLACPCHGSLFDPSNGGQVLQGPAQEPLPEIPVQVQGGQVTKA